MSGVYRVIHHEHRPDYGVVAIKGDQFLPCRECHDRVRYQLFVEADYVTHDWDLSGPNPTLMK